MLFFRSIEWFSYSRSTIFTSPPRLNIENNFVQLLHYTTSFEFPPNPHQICIFTWTSHVSVVTVFYTFKHVGTNFPNGLFRMHSWRDRSPNPPVVSDLLGNQSFNSSVTAKLVSLQLSHFVYSSIAIFLQNKIPKFCTVY